LISRHHDVITKQTTVRVPAAVAEAIAPVRGIGVNVLILDALMAEIARVRL
jgi:hypothetical protein